MSGLLTRLELAKLRDVLEHDAADPEDYGDHRGISCYRLLDHIDAQTALLRRCGEALSLMNRTGATAADLLSELRAAGFAAADKPLTE